MGSQEREPLVQSRAENSQGGIPEESNKHSEAGTLIPDEDNGKPQSIWSGTTLIQKLLLFYVLLIEFLALFSSCTPGPFFARVMVERGGTIIHAVVVLQSLMLSMSVSSILFGKYQPYIGCKALFIAGLGTFGLSQAAFGSLEYIEDVSLFTAVGVFLRVTSGAGAGAFAVASLSLLCQECPNHVPTVFELIEAATAIGLLAAPVFGGPVFDASNMLVPMVSSGSALLVMLFVGILLLRHFTVHEEGRKIEFDICGWLSEPIVIIILGSFGTILGTFGFCNVAITDYLKVLGFSVTHTGLVLFTIGSSYCLSAFAAACVISPRGLIRKLAMGFGFLGFTGITLVYTPHQSTAVIFIGSSILGIFAGLSSIPSFRELFVFSMGPNGIEGTNFAMYSAISGTWHTVLGVGMFVLPLIGSTMRNTAVPFSWSLFASCCIGFISSLLLAAAVFSIKRLKS